MIIKSFSIDYEKLFNNYKVILIYGENYYLKNEIVEKLNNIFKKNNYKNTFIKQDELLNKIDILDNYLNQDSLFGEKEILIIKDTSDKLLNYIDLENLDNKLIIISESLQKNSKLRSIAEKHKLISCIPCYDDDEKTLQSLLRHGINSLGLKVSNETIDQLFSINKLNRSDINSGLTKLRLISKDNVLDNEILSSLFNTTSSFDAFQISDILLSCNKKELNKILSSFYHFSFNFNEILGPLKYKIKRLISIYEFDKEEKSISSLLTKYKPPIFWKEKSSVQTQMSMWNVDQLNTLLDKINHIEILCKENYEVSETIFNKFLLDIITKKVLINTYSSH